MAYWVFSIVLYIATIFVGIYLDTKPAEQYRKQRRIYIVWLYVFLCFGYMTGSDWRNYELTYENGEGIERFVREPASWLFFSFFPKIISDYWLFVGLCKCLFLYSAKLLVSKITTKWMSVLALLIPFQLAFMLIQNPFRFMLSAAVINIALFFLFLYKTDTNYHSASIVIRIFLFLIISVLFHNSCVVLVVLIPVLFLSNYISRINSLLIFVIYLAVAVVSSNLSFINDIKSSSLIFLQSFIEISDYRSYELEDNTSIFSIGNMLKFIYLGFVLLSKRTIITKFKYGEHVFGMTVLYFFISRVVILIPTGFRLALPFITFYVIYIVFMLFSKKKIFALIIIVNISISFVSKLWSNYDLIPYTNSIPYIVMGHKPYEERYMYNLNEYKDRLGKSYEMPTH